MNIVYYKDFITGTCRLDWCSVDSFKKTFIDNTNLFNNRKANLHIAEESHAYHDINTLLSNGQDTKYTVSFSLLLFNRDDFEEMVFCNETLDSIKNLRDNVMKSNSVILDFVAIPNNSFVTLGDFKQLV